MKHFSDYIIEEGLKDKIKQLINKVIKLDKEDKKPEDITYDENDYHKYKDKTLSNQDLDNLIKLVDNENNIFKDSSNTPEYIKLIAFKQALIIYGYHNYKGFIKSKKDSLDLLETSTNAIYVKQCNDFNYEPYTLESNKYAGTIIKLFYSGWWYAETLNIKYEKNIELNFKK